MWVIPLYGQKGDRPYLDHDKRRISNIGHRRGYGERDSPQEEGVG